MSFGTVYAAEFDKEAPPTEYTPMPQAFVEGEYKMEDKKKKEDTEKVDKVTQENDAALSEWDNNFDDNGERNRRRRSRSRRNTMHSRRGISLVDPV